MILTGPSSVLLSSWKRTVMVFFLARSFSSSGDIIDTLFLGLSSSNSRFTSEAAAAAAVRKVGYKVDNIFVNIQDYYIQDRFIYLYISVR